MVKDKVLVEGFIFGALVGAKRENFLRLFLAKRLLTLLPKDFLPFLSLFLNKFDLSKGLTIFVCSVVVEASVDVGPSLFEAMFASVDTLVLIGLLSDVAASSPFGASATLLLLKPRNSFSLSLSCFLTLVENL